MPEATYFKPAGIPMRLLEEIRLSVEELEAVRLRDLERLEQEEAAEKMNISRQTFQRVLASARQKIAEALLYGKAVRIEGGNFEVSPLRFKCARGHEWELPLEVATSAPQFCPVCNTSDIAPPLLGLGWGRGGRRCRRGRD